MSAATDTVDPVAVEILDLLRDRGWMLGAAESLTGGAFGSAIAAVSGASDAFAGSIVSYATEVKRSVLGVTAESVISEDAAIEMARGARRVLGCDIAVSMTGVAGPGLQEGQPAGTVVLGLSVGDVESATRLALDGDRQAVRMATVSAALGRVRDALVAG
ncbi:MAG: CinA family protein [Actinomycetota bacterium]